MTVRKSISFTEKHDEWIKAQMATGHYSSESEVIRELIRQRQMQERESTEEIEAIRAMLVAGEKSGISDRTPEEIRDAVKAELRRDGRL